MMMMTTMRVKAQQHARQHAVFTTRHPVMHDNNTDNTISSANPPDNIALQNDNFPLMNS